MAAPALQALNETFDKMIVRERLHPGAQLVVCHRGQRIVDFVGGYADTQTCSLVTPATLFPLMSAGKPFGSLAILQQVEAGRLSLDDPVAKHWPDFGQNGKETVLIRHILSHRGGFPQFPDGVSWQGMRDRKTMAAAIEKMPLLYPPGEVLAYHHLTQQWACLELVCRTDGRDFATYMCEMVTGPLGLANTHFGAAAKLEPFIAREHAMAPLDPFSSDMVSRTNTRESHGSEAPVFGVSSAGDMARFYAAILAGGSLGGARILSEELVGVMLAVEVETAIDRVTEVPARWSLGFQLSGAVSPEERSFGATSTALTFGHNGGGQVITWADRDLDLAMAFTSNGQVGPEATRRRRSEISNAVRALVGA